jgi:hypothetical protein
VRPSPPVRRDQMITIPLLELACDRRVGLIAGDSQDSHQGSVLIPAVTACADGRKIRLAPPTCPPTPHRTTSRHRFRFTTPASDGRGCSARGHASSVSESSNVWRAWSLTRNQRAPTTVQPVVIIRQPNVRNGHGGMSPHVNASMTAQHICGRRCERWTKAEDRAALSSSARVDPVDRCPIVR